ncbi:MAG TPA: prolyl oligopeptidase family serine peptidase [Steroidobacteraceae bacterium]|jgi:prolyl oligopeptidase|nr:prolyl oligopeptidase family serine peptidase [Steroidobacteraceae bacterium]
MPISARYLNVLLASASLTLFVACSSSPKVTYTPPAATEAAKIAYPPAARGEVVDVYHDVKVADPYRAFENVDAPATRDWVTAENALSQPFLERLPQRAWLGNRLKQLWTYERFGVPKSEAGRYFYLRNDGTQDQSVLYVADALNAPPRVLVDPNNSREDATIALSEWYPSPDGKIMAYALSDGGSDWNIWHFRRVDDGSELPSLKFSKFWPLAWARDSSGVYYSRYPVKPGQNADEATRGDDAGRPDLYFHKLADSQSADAMVFRVADSATRVPSPEITEDGRYLVITLFEGYEANGVMIQDLRKPGAKPRPLFMAWDALYTFIGSKGDTLYFKTTREAPRGRVIAVDASKPAPAAWRTVVPQSKDPIDDAHFVGGRVVVEYTHDATSVLKVFESGGSEVGEARLPGLGTVKDFEGRGTSPEAFFSYADYQSPTRILRLDVANNQVSDYRVPKVPADFTPYVTEQVFYDSKDGTRVPMFIIRRRDAPRDGNQPVMLYGYGGFNQIMSPTFSPQVQAWLELGGIYAVANLRGGGEYGEEWHLAGTKLKKQNVFDDFIAAAEYLVREKYTNPKKLAILGRSNGGLLVGAVLTQRPDLFGAALPGVGVMDMLRYQTASANARQWSSDYGLAENPDEFNAIRAYSPVHNVKQGTCYPPTLITTADHDDRVVPWHSYKFAAELQRAQSCDNPVLIRVETRAGHGSGKPVWMQIEDYADQFGFVANALGMTAPG